MLFTLGIGEAPVGLQGTFSIWRDAKAISDFAYRRPAHAEVVRKTHDLDWYAEEMFTRFQVDSVRARTTVRTSSYRPVERRISECLA